MGASIRLLMPLAAACLFAGCAERRHRDDHTISKTPAGGTITGRPTLGMPIGVPGRTIAIVPFSIETEKGLFADRDPFTRGGSAPRSMGMARYDPDLFTREVRWHNAIVRDLQGGESWPVLEQRGIISKVRFGTSETRLEQQQPRTHAIFYLATVEDSNGDGQLDDRDASVVVASSGDGREPRVVTPGQAQVWEVAYDPDQQMAFFLVVRDTDSDGAFTFADAPEPWVWPVGSEQPARPLVNPEAVERVRGLLE